MKYLVLLMVALPQVLWAQKNNIVTNDALKNNLKATINFLADDKLEGRRTGTAGEKLAYQYIEAQFKKAGLTTYTNNSFIQPFEVNDGKIIATTTQFELNGKTLQLLKDYFPLAYSANVSKVSFNSSSPNVVYYYIDSVIAQNTNNPHFDIKENMLDAAKAAANNKATLFIVKNSSNPKNAIVFDAKEKTPALNIPAIVLDAAVNEAAFTVKGYSVPNATITIQVQQSVRVGHNVIGYINNNAPYTIILGAHYDHLGYGEDHTSLYTGAQPMIHNGADDNASGTAALIALANWVKKSDLKKYNVVFVAFSGEELGLFGSKYFVEQSGIDVSKVNYMINMDMVGRLNDSTHGLTVGGYGTSPTWGNLIKTNDTYFKINIDSSGSGPSDHTSFYKKDIPVLFFFTGSHKDYHKPSDDADKINYEGAVAIIKYIEQILTATNNMDKLTFTKTREAAAMGKSSFKVSLGIMPDYTFSGVGVMVDGVSENKPAIKAGVKTGDVLLQLGDYKFTDVQSYMNTLSKFNKGDSTQLKIKRGNEEITLPITF
ncbi:M20/M25/M40 family metallo-hydrolase [Ferruginibacter yonginensis]|uniref:M20/M25/M40 family metallo-hydrolase n=1 Tax=Ferruginibacter yonginensis TaxID=1310416 RepID=A0ABV8QRV5_9BACT